MTESADVTVCIPVYNGAAFVTETLESLQRQTATRIKVLISVDASDDASLEICRDWEAPGVCDVVGQPERLGWVENVNWLLRRVDTPFACLLFHDDWIVPGFLERLVARLQQHPEAVIAYGDICAFGTLDLQIVQPSLTGDPFDRVMTFLLDRTAATEMHGVFRTDAMQRTNLLRSDADGFAADALWLLELAAHGEFLREPGVVYHKRYHEDSITSRWLARSPEQAALDWVDHGAGCLEAALGTREWTVAQRQHLAAAVLIRAVQFVHTVGHQAPSPPDLTALLARLAHVTLRIAGVLPDRTALPDEAELSASLRTRIDTTLGRLLLPGSAHECPPPEEPLLVSATPDVLGEADRSPD